MYSVRFATKNDAEEAVEVLRRSISELCTADHKSNEDDLNAWLANKTVDQYVAWLNNPDQTMMVVTDEDGSVAGVGALVKTGEILLMYVSPDRRFAGVSKQLLAAMEMSLAGEGIDETRLQSSVTAHDFYLSGGYEDFGSPVPHGGNVAYPMRKVVAGGSTTDAAE